MKKYILSLFCGLLLFAAGCDHDLDTWSGKDMAYIDLSTGTDIDSTVVSFVYMNTDVETYTVTLYIRFMGDVNPGARQVAVRVNADGTNAIAGQDYEPLPASYTIEGGYTYCLLPVVLLRNESLKEMEKYLTVELVANENFGLLYPEDGSSPDKIYSKTSHKIYFSELMNEAPQTWREYQFGKFSPEKFQTICDVMEIPREKFTDFTYMTIGRANFVASYMKQYFIDMEKAGTPVLEKDRTPMKMGDNI